MPKTNNPLTRSSGVSTNVILTSIVVVAAVLIIGGILLFGGGRVPDRGEPVPPQTLSKPDSHRVMDAPGDKVTVVEFLDFQCPVCAQYHQSVTSKVEERYAGRIDFITRNYPLPKPHPLAIPAARAAEAAGMQGKYKEMYDKLYQNWQSWAVAPNGKEVNRDEKQANQAFEQYAEQIGLDMDKFRNDRDSPQVQQRINQDVTDGDHAGVDGTPTIFVNGREFTPKSRDYDEIADQLSEQIDGELKP